MRRRLTRPDSARQRPTPQLGALLAQIAHFTRALEADPTNHVLYSDRSGAHAAKSAYAESLLDANKCIELKGDWAGGHSRQGAANFGLENWIEAQASYQRCLVLDPSSQWARDELSKVNEHILTGSTRAEQVLLDRISHAPAPCRLVVLPASTTAVSIRFQSELSRTSASALAKTMITAPDDACGFLQHGNALRCDLGEWCGPPKEVVRVRSSGGATAIGSPIFHTGQHLLTFRILGSRNNDGEYMTLGVIDTPHLSRKQCGDAWGLAPFQGTLRKWSQESAINLESVMQGTLHGQANGAEVDVAIDFERKRLGFRVCPANVSRASQSSAGRLPLEEQIGIHWIQVEPFPTAMRPFIRIGAPTFSSLYKYEVDRVALVAVQSDQQTLEARAEAIKAAVRERAERAAAARRRQSEELLAAVMSAEAALALAFSASSLNGLRHALVAAKEVGVPAETLVPYQQRVSELEAEAQLAKYARLTAKAEDAKQEDGFALRPLIVGIAGDDEVLVSLQALLDNTDHSLLGKGKDVQVRFGSYDKLTLACAWRVDHPRELSKYEMGKARVLEEMTILTRKGKLPGRILVLPTNSVHGMPLDSDANEAVLLHGTSAASLLAILSSGLNERFSGTSAGNAFGDGVYFAEDVGKTDQYVTPDLAYDPKSDLHRRLFGRNFRHPGSLFYVVVCRVALGYPICTRQHGAKSVSLEGGPVFERSFRELAAIPGISPPILHHSLIAELGGSLSRYREFVVFHGEYLLPEYVVGYHRCNGNTVLQAPNDTVS